MTRQQDDEEERSASGGARTLSSQRPPPSLLLHVRTVADALHVVPAASMSPSIATFDARRAAFVLRHPLPSTTTASSSSGGGGARLGVLTPALTWMSVVAATDDAPQDAGAWPLAWSPDGAFVVLCGGASVWLCTTRAWIADGEPESDGAQLLLARAELSKWLAVKELTGSSRVVAAFFAEHNSSRLFLVLDGGLLVKVDVQVPKLALLALKATAAVAAESEVKAMLKMKVVKRLGEWHAGVAAATFDAASATLVITGGLKNPSDVLVRGRASSLSVWKVLPDAPFSELLDYTMVLNEVREDAASGSEATEERAADVDLSASTEPSGLLGAMTHSVFSPLKFIIGRGTDVRVLHGSVRQLAVSPDGAYVSMLDAWGRVSVRQIEACSDVIGWQAVGCASERASAADGRDGGAVSRVKSVVWLSATVLEFVLEDGHTVFGALKKRDFDISERVPSEVADESGDYVLVATDSASAFAKALSHLSLIQDKSWVVGECLRVVASDSFMSMKDILETGLLALDGVANEEDVSAKRQQLQRYIYRLETLKMVLAEDLVEDQVAESEDPLRVAEQCYDGAAFAQFRSVAVVDTAKQLAREGRVGSLAVLFQRNARSIVPRRLEVLSQLPASVPPFTYSHLLPAVGPDARDDGQLFFTLQPQSSFQEFDDPLNTSLGSISLESRVVEAELDADDASCDLDAADREVFELSARQSDHERRKAYAAWFQARILEMDTLFGQLANAYQLSSLARECLRGDWRDSDVKNAFDRFQHDVERLYNCIYPLQLSACCLLSLEEWSALSLHDQIVHVIGDWDSATDAIDRIQAVFVAHRGGALYTLDDAFSSLCHTLSRKCSLSALEVCAQLIHHSNPSMPVVERWIQNDAQLLRLALSVVYSATTQSYFHSADDLAKHHRVFVEQLWMIFQSLPVRKEEELPEIEQLQVAVDEMEDLMVTMDVLSKYGVLSSPSELRDQVGAASSAASGLLQRMCEFSLPGSSVGDEDSAVDSETQQQRWMEVWHDAMKLKTHVFGERVSQEAILDGILRHLLSHDEYLDAAEHLATNWIGTNLEAIHHVIVVLIRTVQSKMDTLRGNVVSDADLKTYAAALKCIDIAKRVLSSPPPEHELERKAHFERQLWHEIELVHACQLLDLLSYGGVKLAPGAIRPLKDANQRLDIILEVFTSNPSNYQPSKRARDWFTEHRLEHVVQQSDSPSKPLDAVLYLSKLLRVEDQKHQIMMKGAYAALYCADYDVAYGLTAEVVKSLVPTQGGGGESNGSRRGRNEDVELQHLMSLVLDLVSAASFQSWSKKLKLCRATFSVLNVSMFGHQIANLILSRMERLEAIEALAVELGLSEADVEERRHHEGNARAGVEELLLKELEIVVELLQEEKNDRGFLLRLLQRGLQLSCIVLTGALVQQAEDDAGLALGLPTWTEETQRATRIVQHMTRICFVEAIAGALTADEDDRALSSGTARASSEWSACAEMGCSYLLLWSDFAGDECDLEAFWDSEVLPLLSDSFASAASSAVTRELDRLVRQLHHFFLVQVASAVHACEADGGAGPALVLELQEGRRRLEKHSRSYEEAKRFVASKHVEPEEAPEDDFAWATNGDDTDGEPTKTEPQSRSVCQRAGVFARLATRCQDTMLSQRKTQELEEMSAFLNAELDLDRFSRDADYRVRTILALASRKEHYHTAKQFAAKYGVDEYQCLLAYIRSALLAPADASSSVLSRHEQLERAFRSESEDFMEHALQQPVVFGRFLLSATGDSVYESLEGTDHVGILLVLRMVLECSKRVGQLPEDARAAALSEVDDVALFPFSKASSDRVALLFVCLKRLREVEPLKHPRDGDVPDFKLVCGAETSADLLRAPATPASANASRRAAVEALLPFLNGKSIKLLTKLLQKLHRVSTSAVVLIYLNAILGDIWREQRGASDSPALAADLAVYAYEACTPFFSVLTNDHLLLFHCLFLGTRHDAALAIDLADEFYGQQLNAFAHFGRLLTPQKRVDVVSETLGVFQTRFEAWAVACADSEPDASVLAAKQSELRFLERELAQAALWFVADEVERNAVVFAFAEASWRLWEHRMQLWLSTAEGELLEILVLLCQSVSSVEVASLLVELVLLASPSSASVADSAPVVMRQAYARGFASFVETQLGGSSDAERQIVGEWTSSFPDAHSALSEQFRDVARFVSALCGGSDSSASRQLLSRVAALLSRVPSAAVQATVASAASRDAQAAVVGEWRRVSAQWEHEHQFASSAVLARLVLDCGAAAVTADDLSSYEREFFGLQTKAAFAHLRLHEELNAVFALPATRVFDTFDGVFTSAIALVGSAASDANLRAALTVTLANLLWFHARTADALQPAVAGELLNWEQEQRVALATRLRSQFSVGEQPLSVVDSDGESSSSSSAWWAALLLHGAWRDDDALVTWYLTLAYGRIRAPRVLEDFAAAHWGGRRRVCAELLLASPFPALHAHHRERLLAFAAGASSARRVLELLLLRFDLQTLLRAGLHAQLVRVFVESESSSGCEQWTSSGAYAVCALVALGEFARAGRLACALWHTHPLLWDWESAQLTLGNYLKSLAAGDDDDERLRDVYVLASSAFQRRA